MRHPKPNPAAMALFNRLRRAGYSIYTAESLAFYWFNNMELRVYAAS